MASLVNMANGFVKALAVGTATATVASTANAINTEYYRQKELVKDQRASIVPNINPPHTVANTSTTKNRPSDLFVVN